MCYCKHWERSMPQTMHFHVPSAYSHENIYWWNFEYIHSYMNLILQEMPTCFKIPCLISSIGWILQTCLLFRGEKKPSSFSVPCLYVYLMHSVHEGRFSLNFWKTDKYDCQYQYKMGQASQLKETDNQLAKEKATCCNEDLA